MAGVESSKPRLLARPRRGFGGPQPQPPEPGSARGGSAGDFRWRVNEKWGVQGEIFTGQGLGTYGGGVLQTVNSATFETIETSGGWAEVYYYCTPCVHTHWGYGIDNPDNGDLAVGQTSYNDTIWANLIWDVTKSFRLANEFTYRTTDYLALPDNDGFGYHWQMQWKF